MAFNHKHLIDITEYSEEDIKLILETAKAFSEVNERAIKKVPTLKGKTIVNMFNEPSTRTRSSFELAEKRLSADSLNFGGSSTSTVKGESLVDTVETLNAYKIDCIVVRDKHAGAPYIVTQNSPASVICAGDGKHNHPTQALLDLYTIWEHKGDFHGLKVAVVGDIAHSRVCGSLIPALKIMGCETYAVAPGTLLPPAVYGYILRHWLYGTHADLKHLPLSQLRPVALSYLKYKRIPHVLGTEQEAIRLAERYGADVEKARVAALLHDCTKKLNMDEQLALCGQYGIELDELEQKALKLLHAKTGAAIARDVFGVDDEIYRAIWWHTTGHANMTLLEKIIYLADYIEPSRNFPGVDKLRKMCYEDLNAGLLLGLEMSIEEMTEMGNPVPHATIEARDALKG